jgi:hypothetical protein
VEQSTLLREQNRVLRTWTRLLPRPARSLRTLPVRPVIYRTGLAPRCQDCELADTHASSHIVFAGTTEGDDRWWWLHWSGRIESVVQADPCPVEEPCGSYTEPCLLPQRHPGPHSFQLEGR